MATVLTRLALAVALSSASVSAFTGGLRAARTRPLSHAVRMRAVGAGETVTILGPGNKPVQLIAAKVAADAGYKTNVLIDNIDGLNQARVMTYGRVYARNMNDPVDKPQFIVGGESLGTALATSEGLIVCSDGQEVKSLVESAIKGSPKLKRVTLLSRNGGSSGAMADSELALKAAAEAAGAEWSIVRVGLVKGGGPGNVARGDSIGLDEYFYNTNPEINSFQKDKFADQYLLGAKLKPGDTVANNPFQMIFASQATSVAAEGSVNRNIAARVLVQSLFQPGCANADFSVDSTRGLAVPTQESFDKAFSDCFQSGEGICEYKPEDIPEAIESPATSMRKQQQEGQTGEALSSSASSTSSGSFKLGASTREEELARKQLIGHIIPVAIAAGIFVSGSPLIPQL